MIQADGRSTGLPAEAFDLVTARLVLVNVPQPHEIVAEAFRLARPGGAVAFHEADAVSRLCDPPLEAWTQLFDAIKSYSRRNGMGPTRPAPRRPGLDPPGHVRRRILEVFVDNLADRLIADDLITAEDLDTSGRTPMSTRPAARSSRGSARATCMAGVGPKAQRAKGGRVMIPLPLSVEAGYRLGSDRGSPNDGSTLLSKWVMAQI